MAGAGLSFEIKLEGAKEVASKLDPKHLLKDPLKVLLTLASLKLERTVKQYTPVDTGRLRASFGGGSYSGGSFPKGTGVIFDQTPMAKWVQFGTNVEYALDLETSSRKSRGVGRIPFFGPAVDSLKSNMNDVIEKARQKIEEKWGKK